MKQSPIILTSSSNSSYRLLFSSASPSISSSFLLLLFSSSSSSRLPPATLLLSLPSSPLYCCCCCSSSSSSLPSPFPPPPSGALKTMGVLVASIPPPPLPFVAYCHLVDRSYCSSTTQTDPSQQQSGTISTHPRPLTHIRHTWAPLDAQRARRGLLSITTEPDTPSPRKRQHQSPVDAMTGGSLGTISPSFALSPRGEAKARRASGDRCLERDLAPTGFGSPYRERSDPGRAAGLAWPAFRAGSVLHPGRRERDEGRVG